jgi:hypothetical protein
LWSHCILFHIQAQHSYNNQIFNIVKIKIILKFSFSPPTYYLQLVNLAISYMFTHESTILNVCYYFILMVFCFIFKNYINIIGSMYLKINTLQSIHYIDVRKLLMFSCVAYILIISIVWTYFESFYLLKPCGTLTMFIECVFNTSLHWIRV